MSIVIQNLTKRFGDKTILHGLDFEFETGQLNMIIGASGSGKSVTMKCMVGLYSPDAGAVAYDGQHLHAMHPKALRQLRQQIGMLFQASALFDSMNVEQNVGFPLRMFTSLKLAERRDRVAEILEAVGLEGTQHLTPAELSGGMRKRAGLARALVMRPKYLFADEPNSGLDPKTAGMIDELIQRVTYEFETTTVVITHDMKSVLDTADKVMFIHDGHKAWEGRREEIAHATEPRFLEFVRMSGLQLERAEQGTSGPSSGV